VQHQDQKQEHVTGRAKHGDSMKKGFHKTADGRTARKGLYYYANKRKKAGKKPIARGKKGYVTRAAVTRSARTAKR